MSLPARRLPACPVLCFVLCVACLVLPSTPSAPAQPASFELVYTPPAECDLQQPDLRSPQVVWPALFDSAQTHIDIEQFYLTDGPALRPVIASLRRATVRGVRLRVLVDATLQENSQPLIDELRSFPNTQVRIIPFRRLLGGVVHNKMLLVDGRRAYVGSQNFDWRSLTHIHELGLRIDDPRLSGQLQALFDMDWAMQATLEQGQPVPAKSRERPQSTPAQPTPDPDAYLVASPPGYLPTGIGESEGELVRIIERAQRRLQIQLLLYAPLDQPERSFYSPIDTALRAAAARGVKIDLLVSDWNTRAPKIDWLKSLALVPGVQIKIVTLPEARSGFIPYARVIHAKYMVVDEALLWLGTSNWQGGYFDRSRNVEIVLKNPALAGRAAAIHTQLWQSRYAQPVDVTRRYIPPRVF